MSELPAVLNVTRTVYRVLDFLSWQRSKSLVLRPFFQRGSVWNRKAKSYLIDSILRGFPVPILFLQDRTDKDTHEAIRHVVDGQQRLRTVLGFVDLKCLKDYSDDDDFQILPSHNPDLAGLRFKELSQEAKDRILNFEFSVHVLPAGAPNSTILEVFSRLNSSGVRLNDQELRNAEFHGEFRLVCTRLALEWTDQWLEWKVFGRSQVARMAEVELTSELVQFMIQGFQGKSQPALNQIYSTYDDNFPNAEAVLRRFRAVMTSLQELWSPELDEIFGEEFSETGFNSRGWFYPLFVAMYRAMYDNTALTTKIKPKSLDAKKLRQKLMKKSEELDSPDIPAELAKALRGASTDKKSREARLEFIEEAF